MAINSTDKRVTTDGNPSRVNTTKTEMAKVTVWTALVHRHDTGDKEHNSEDNGNSY
jgi:hypothetical protein